MTILPETHTDSLPLIRLRTRGYGTVASEPISALLPPLRLSRLYEYPRVYWVGLGELYRLGGLDPMLVIEQG